MLMHCHEIAIFKQRAILVPERQNHYNNKHNERIFFLKNPPKNKSNHVEVDVSVQEKYPQSPHSMSLV